MADWWRGRRPGHAVLCSDNCSLSSFFTHHSRWELLISTGSWLPPGVHLSWARHRRAASSARGARLHNNYIRVITVHHSLSLVHVERREKLACQLFLFLPPRYIPLLPLPSLNSFSFDLPVSLITLELSYISVFLIRPSFFLFSSGTQFQQRHSAWHQEFQRVTSQVCLVPFFPIVYPRTSEQGWHDT